MDQEGEIMAIISQNPVPVIDDHQVAEAGGIPIRKNHRPAGGGKHRLADQATDVDAAVPAPEWLGDNDRKNRPGEITLI